jgi:hypothetical protein
MQRARIFTTQPTLLRDYGFDGLPAGETPERLPAGTEIARLTCPNPDAYRLVAARLTGAFRLDLVEGPAPAPDLVAANSRLDALQAELLAARAELDTLRPALPQLAAAQVEIENLRAAASATCTIEPSILLSISPERLLAQAIVDCPQDVLVAAPVIGPRNVGRLTAWAAEILAQTPPEGLPAVDDADDDVDDSDDDAPPPITP